MSKLITVHCPVNNCHVGGVSWANEKDEDFVRNNHLNDLRTEHKDHKAFNQIIDEEPNPEKRDWSRL